MDTIRQPGEKEHDLHSDKANQRLTQNRLTEDDDDHDAFMSQLIGDDSQSTPMADEQSFNTREDQADQQLRSSMANRRSKSNAFSSAVGDTDTYNYSNSSDQISNLLGSSAKHLPNAGNGLFIHEGKPKA